MQARPRLGADFFTPRTGCARMSVSHPRGESDTPAPMDRVEPPRCAEPARTVTRLGVRCADFLKRGFRIHFSTESRRATTDSAESPVVGEVSESATVRGSGRRPTAPDAPSATGSHRPAGLPEGRRPDRRPPARGNRVARRRGAPKSGTRAVDQCGSGTGRSLSGAGAGGPAASAEDVNPPERILSASAVVIAIWAIAPRPAGPDPGHGRFSVSQRKLAIAIERPA